MSADATLAELAHHVGVFSDFTDMQGVVRPTSPDTQRALLRANGLAVDTAVEVTETLGRMRHEAAQAYISGDIVVTCDVAQQIDVSGPVEWSVLCEDGGAVLAEGQADTQLSLPALPAGVHNLRMEGAKGIQSACLIAAPAQVPSLSQLTGSDKTWGVVAALYGLMAESHKTLGDFTDLAAFAQVLGQHGAGFVGINPVHAIGTAAQDTISPYSPSHRGFLNTDHIAPRSALKRGDTPAGMLDYTAHRSGHRRATRSEFATFQSAASQTERAEFDAFCLRGGQELTDFAHFEQLSTTHGADWRHWPKSLHQPHMERPQDDPEVIYHLWLQWRADSQLAGAQAAARASGMTLGLYLDLAVGARLGGAETWGGAGATAEGVALGAPPDHLSPAGQNWHLAAMAPHKLQATHYKDFRHILAQTMRHCGVLRIDHALGLNRSYWIPEDGSPGGYIRQPFRSLMAVIAIEAQRAGTLVVGEDLGLVPQDFRAAMTAKGLYGYSVLQYEKNNDGNFLPLEHLRPQSLACFGTHDTPTFRGFWEGRDIDWWHRLGWIDPDTLDSARARRQDETRQFAGVQDTTVLSIPDHRDQMHARLADCPAALVAVQLDDILDVAEAQNLPGTIDEHPNWRRRTQATVADIARSPHLAKTADLMTHAGRSTPTRKDST